MPVPWSNLSQHTLSCRPTKSNGWSAFLRRETATCSFPSAGALPFPLTLISFLGHRANVRYRAWANLKKAEGSRGMDSLNRFLHGSMREPMPTASVHNLVVHAALHLAFADLSSYFLVLSCFSHRRTAPLRLTRHRTAAASTAVSRWPRWHPTCTLLPANPSTMPKATLTWPLTLIAPVSHSLLCESKKRKRITSRVANMCAHTFCCSSSART